MVICMKNVLFSVFTILFLISCNQEKPHSQYSNSQIDSLKNLFKKYTRKNDHEFKTAGWSPLSADDKLNFTGLRYYPYQIDWRFEGSITKHTNPDSAQIIGGRKGDVRPAIKYGYFEFEKENMKHQLQIYKIFPSRIGGKAHLFLGFWDETSGNETYSGGRYIDIEENPQNYYVIDFNYAYNPYCAYSDRYSCAIPPWENRLKIDVNAGEKMYKKH